MCFRRYRIINHCTLGQPAGGGRRRLCAIWGRDSNMADAKVFRLIGWAYGGVTAIIVLIALVVVTAHVNTAVEARSETAVLSAR
jgi:hypothetical protein